MKSLAIACLLVLVATAYSGTPINSEHANNLSEVFIMYNLDFEDEALSDVLQFISICGPGDVGHARLHLSQKISKTNVTYTLDFCPHILHHADITPACILGDKPEQEIASSGPAITFKTNRMLLTKLLDKITKKAAGTLVLENKKAVMKVNKPSK